MTSNGQTPGTALAVRPGQDMFDAKQRAALDTLGITGATNAEMAVFMHYCQKTGLDPFSRQVYMIARREQHNGQWTVRQTIQTGIDGFRVIRDRIAARLGIEVEYEDTIWYDADGTEHNVWLWDEPPVACRVTVLRNGRRFPAVVRTASYMAVKDGKPVSQWRTQADHMIEKCAEAAALRRAFPNDLGGLYTDDEMPAAEPVHVRAERVTVADILAQPQTPATQQASTGEQPHSSARESARSATAESPDTTAPHRTQAGKPALDRLANAFETLQLDDTEQTTVIGWLAAGEWTASATQVKNVAGVLDDFLKAAGGDVAEARTAMWTQYAKATGNSYDAQDSGDE